MGLTCNCYSQRIFKHVRICHAFYWSDGRNTPSLCEFSPHLFCNQVDRIVGRAFCCQPILSRMNFLFAFFTRRSVYKRLSMKRPPRETTPTELHLCLTDGNDPEGRISTWVVLTKDLRDLSDIGKRRLAVPRDG